MEWIFSGVTIMEYLGVHAMLYQLQSTIHRCTRTLTEIHNCVHLMRVELYVVEHTLIE